MKSAQPLLKHDQAEQQLVVVLTPSFVVVEQLAHGARLEKPVHQRASVQEEISKPSPHRRMKPPVNYIYGKTALPSVENARRQIAPADLPVQPFASASSDFEARTQPLRIFYHGPIEVGDASLQ